MDVFKTRKLLEQIEWNINKLPCYCNGSTEPVFKIGKKNGPCINFEFNSPADYTIIITDKNGNSISARLEMGSPNYSKAFTIWVRIRELYSNPKYVQSLEDSYSMKKMLIALDEIIDTGMKK